jgi:glycosyltransferase involved in cell wall biosynthesis
LSLQAFALARLKGSEFFIVGDGDDRKRLEDLSNRLGISEWVKFLGGLSRLEAWQRLEQCHVLVHPCLRGSTTMACMEAMAAGRPVIAVRLGMGAVTVPTQETGFMVDASSPIEAVTNLATAMAQLAIHPGLRTRMGIAARKLVASSYIWDGSIDLICACYEKSCPERHWYSHPPLPARTNEGFKSEC